MALAAGTDAALQNALDLWVRIRANENDEGVMLLSSKIHSDLHQDLSESYPFHLEDIIAAPLHLPSSSKAPSESTEWSRWWNSIIIPPLRSIKKEMQSIPVLSGNDQSSGRATSKTNDASVENSGQQSIPSKSKKKKKEKSKKKKAAAAAVAVESGNALDSNVAENAIRTSSADNAPPSTPSVEAPSIKPSLSTDQSSADAADLSIQEAIQTQANTTAVTPTRGSITVGAGNNTVVGLGRMMEEEEHHDDGWETVPTKGAEKRNNNNSKKSGGGPDNKGAGGNGGGDTSRTTSSNLLLRARRRKIRAKLRGRRNRHAGSLMISFQASLTTVSLDGVGYYVVWVTFLLSLAFSHGSISPHQSFVCFCFLS